jgi:hypothetical protein
MKRQWAALVLQRAMQLFCLRCGKGLNAGNSADLLMPHRDARRSSTSITSKSNAPHAALFYLKILLSKV